MVGSTNFISPNKKKESLGVLCGVRRGINGTFVDTLSSQNYCYHCYYYGYYHIIIDSNSSISSSNSHSSILIVIVFFLFFCFFCFYDLMPVC